MGRITAIYNNVEGDKRLKTGWGSSILIEHDNELILFDTGPDGEDLLFNLDILGLDRRRINKVVISHAHRDHKGALDHVLGKFSRNVELFLPGAIKEKKEIADHINVYAIKRLKAPENVLTIDSPRGLIVLIGCAHPGAYRIARTIKDNSGKGIYAVLGGLHFEYFPPILVKILGHLLKRLGVRVMGPNHCTGERAREVLRRIFKEGFLNFGCGQVFTYGDKPHYRT